MLIMANRHHMWALGLLLALLPIVTKAQPSNSQRGAYLYERQHPLRETRAVWLTTIGGLDWPRIKATDANSRKRQQEELIRILDNYQRANINTVIFQTRCPALPFKDRALGTEPHGHSWKKPWLRPAGLLH